MSQSINSTGSCTYDPDDPTVLNCDADKNYNLKNVSTNYGSYLFVPALNLSGNMPRNCYLDKENFRANCVQYLDSTTKNIYPKLSPYYISVYSSPNSNNNYLVQDLPKLPSQYSISYYNPDPNTNMDYPVCLINTDSATSLVDKSSATCFAINPKNNISTIDTVYSTSNTKVSSMPNVKFG
jgi:hypothetical protein